MCFTALKKSKELFEAEMAELGSQRDMQTKESEAMAKISGLEKKIQSLNRYGTCFNLHPKQVMTERFQTDDDSLFLTAERH
jgi:hypothetical protein